jgi:hypothetical protein
MKPFCFIITFFLWYNAKSQNFNSQDQTQLKLEQALKKKAEYHKATNGEQDGYRIKIHFGIDKEIADGVRTKFQKSFPDCLTYREYQQPNFVVLIGDYKSKLEAFKFLNEIKSEFPNAYIIKDKINVK